MTKLLDRLEEISHAHKRAKYQLFVQAVACDNVNGRPFLNYLELSNDETAIKDLMFAGAATQYRLDMDLVTDTRPLTRRARPIFERFLGAASPDAIDVTETIRAKVATSSARATVNVFDPALQVVLLRLEV